MRECNHGTHEGVQKKCFALASILWVALFLQPVTANEDGGPFFGSSYCETNLGTQVQEFDAFVRLQFDSEVDIDATGDGGDKSLRTLLEETVGSAYKEFIARGCDLEHHRSFAGPDHYPPRIIQPVDTRTQAPSASPTSSAAPSSSPTHRPTTSQAPTAAPIVENPPFTNEVAETPLPTAAPIAQEKGTPAPFPLNPPFTNEVPETPRPNTSPPTVSLEVENPPFTNEVAETPRPIFSPPTGAPTKSSSPSNSPTHRPSASPTAPPTRSTPPTTLPSRGEIPQRRTLTLQRAVAESSSITDFVVLHLRLKTRTVNVVFDKPQDGPQQETVPVDGVEVYIPPEEQPIEVVAATEAASTTTNNETAQSTEAFVANAFEAPNSPPTSPDDTLGFGRQVFFQCALNDMKDATVFMSTPVCSHLEFDFETGCQCAVDACFCPRDEDPDALTQDQFLTVLQSYLPLTTRLRELRSHASTSLQVSDAAAPMGGRALNSVGGVTQVAELEEFSVCQASKVVKVQIVHLIDQDPSTVGQGTLHNFTNKVTNLVNSANRNNCDSSFRQILGATLDVGGNPAGRRHLRGLNENDGTLYSYSFTFEMVVGTNNDGAPDASDFFSKTGIEQRRQLASNDDGATANILTDAETGARRCFCPKFVDTFPRRSISFEEYQTEVKALVEAEQIIPGATKLDAIVELEERRCGGNGQLVTGKSTVLVQLNVPTSSLTSGEKGELELACLSAYNQQNSLLSCDAQQYRVTACTLSPLYPELPSLVNGTTVKQGGDSTEARFDFSFSCVDCSAAESPFASGNTGRRSLKEQTAIAELHQDHRRRQLNEGNNATCLCPKNSPVTAQGDRPTVDEFVVSLNVTGQVGQAEDALETSEEECGTGVVLFTTVALEIDGDLLQLNQDERTELENIFRETVNDLSIELCDPSYIYAFAANLITKDKDKNNDNNALMDVGYVCHGDECFGGGAEDFIFSQTGGRFLSEVSSRFRGHKEAASVRAQQRFLDKIEAVIPTSPCLCDRRRTQENTKITQEVFNERLGEEIEKTKEAEPDTFTSINSVRATGVGYEFVITSQAEASFRKTTSTMMLVLSIAAVWFCFW